MDEDYKESEISKIVKRLMDEEGFEFGEAVKEAMEQTKKFESKADGGSIGIEVLFTDKMANGGRVPMVSGGALKSIGSGIMKMFSKGDDAVDLGKQEEIFRSGNITTDFLENVDDKVIKKFVTTRDAKGPGGYGLYDSFDDMPNGLKAAELISRIKNADGGIDYEAAELFIGKKLKGNETVNELISMVVTEKKADGGRVGLFMGGDPLTGQALAIYNSMSAYGATDQAIADRLQSLGYYDPNASTTDPTPDTGQTIGYQGGNDGGGITELTPLNTKTNISSGINRNDKTFIDPLNEKIASQMINQNPNLNKYTTEEVISMNPDMFNIKTNKGFIGNTIDNFKTKVGQGATKFKNMAITPMMALMQKRNPLNPNAVNYNPNLQGQMDFLEATTGKKITGTSDNLKFTDALMIGQDPNSGLTKYGPGSVLSGQNVVSGFGSNDYEKALNKYLTRMSSYTNPTKFQQEKIKQAQKELEAAQAKQAIADMAAEQSTIDKAKSNYADVYQSAQDQGFTGPGGGFSTSGAAPGTSLGSGQFSSKSSKGRKDYSQGGLATMFTRRR